MSACRIGTTAALFVCGISIAWGDTGTAGSDGPVTTKGISTTFVPILEARKAIQSGTTLAAKRSVVNVSTSSPTAQVTSTEDFGGASTLPLWTFDAYSSRDGRKHHGAMVGTSPFSNPGTARVPTKVIPVVLKIHSIGTGIDANGNITTVPGNVTVNPNSADNTCFAAPNNVPTKLFLQSPLIQPAPFSIGPTYVGTTQYVDAFMRGNFYNALGHKLDSYHLLLDPVNTLDAVVIDVPAVQGLAITDPNFFGSPPICTPFVIIDINWFDDYLNDRLLNDMQDQGVNPTTLPVFFLYNTVMSAPANSLGNCCVLGYHSYGGFPTPAQTYSVGDFDSSGAFGPGTENTDVLAHELDEWANDPYGINLVPPWGGVGQVSGCQANLEVGDPLSGTNFPPVTMPNGFTYNLQELAFFSWFLGAPSIAVNGWYSDNNTFTTDAGTPCTYQ
jgi:hypothetical protein